jgi:hypothetical protein
MGLRRSGGPGFDRGPVDGDGDSWTGTTMAAPGPGPGMGTRKGGSAWTGVGTWGRRHLVGDAALGRCPVEDAVDVAM